MNPNVQINFQLQKPKWTSTVQIKWTLMSQNPQTNLSEPQLCTAEEDEEERTSGKAWGVAFGDEQGREASKF